MKTELRLEPHSVTPGQLVVELWWEGAFIGQVCGAEGGGVRVISKHPMVVLKQDMVVEVLISTPKQPT